MSLEVRRLSSNVWGWKRPASWQARYSTAGSPAPATSHLGLCIVLLRPDTVPLWEPLRDLGCAFGTSNVEVVGQRDAAFVASYGLRLDGEAGVIAIPIALSTTSNGPRAASFRRSSWSAKQQSRLQQGNPDQGPGRL